MLVRRRDLLTGSAAAAAYAALPRAAKAQSNYPSFPPGVFQSRGAIDAAPASSSFLLDVLGVSAARAYSMRKLRSAYAGSAIRVRETGGGTQQDIGFDGSGNLNTSALSSFVGANNGFIAKWYDQSGNADDLVQATTASQPRIVSSGTIDTRNSLPCAFSAPSSTLVMAGASSFTAAEASIIVATSDVGAWANFNGILTDATSQVAFIGDNSTSFYTGGQFGSTIFVDGGANTTKFSGTLQQVDGNGSGATWGVPQIFQDRGNTSHFSLDGWLGEVVIFATALSSGNRTAMRTNQKAYWGTA